MPFNLSLRQLLGAFFSFVLILSNAHANTSGPTFPDDNDLIETLSDIVLVDGKPVRINILHKRFSVEFEKVDALGMINFKRDPMFYDRNFKRQVPKHLYQIDQVLILYNQVFLLVSDTSLPKEVKPELKLLQVHLKFAGGLQAGAEKDVWMSLGAVAIGAYDALSAYAHHACTQGSELGVAQIGFAAGATSVAVFSTIAAQKFYQIYRVQNEFIEIDQVKTLSGSENGVAISQVPDEGGKIRDVTLHLRGGGEKSLAQMAFKSMCEISLINEKKATP